MLENLVIAVESESQGVDIGRVSGFMQKVWFYYCHTSHFILIQIFPLQVRDGII